jgi:hypothetical protein
MRAPGDWAPRVDSSLRLQFRSLAYHLLLKYPAPGYLDSVWDLPPGANAFRQQAWFIKLGRGSSMRSLELPMDLTRGMEHHARQAPDHYTAMQALRYGEIMGQGGSKSLAVKLALSDLSHEEKNACFWRSVVQFFIAHPEYPEEAILPTLQFINAHKFGANPSKSVENSADDALAFCPNFTMKGRTAASMLRLVNDWRQFTGNAAMPRVSWDQSGLKGFRRIERDSDGESLVWTIIELSNSSALQTEGGHMRHCVGSYVDKCRWRKSSIWSLRLEKKNERKRLATIEVQSSSRSIIQIKAKSNRRPGPKCVEIISQWAEAAGLYFSLAELRL